MSNPNEAVLLLHRLVSRALEGRAPEIFLAELEEEELIYEEEP
jgi:hypothetical protein